MSLARREIYRSSNGDCWYLAREPENGQAFVVHTANLPSGGKMSTINIGDFLRPGANGPEHQALLRMIATLIGTPDSDLQKAGDEGLPDAVVPTFTSPHCAADYAVVTEQAPYDPQEHTAECENCGKVMAVWYTNTRPIYTRVKPHD